jgi:ubiquinone biosynthesis protein UbiJ
MTATPAWLATIEALINRGIAGSAEASGLAQRLNGTALLIEIQGMKAVRAGVSGGRLGLMAADSRTAAVDDPPAQADAVISGSPLALLQLARGEAAARGGTGARGGPAPRSAAAEIRGDAEIANTYRRLFASARPDVEEELSRLIGDFPARRVSQLAAQAFGWARRAGRTAGQNVAEYLQEESRVLVNQTELEEFLHGVDALRDTAERIEARLLRLERRLKDPPK